MYDLELDKVIKEIKKQKARTVCIQLPDGLKPRAKEIADRIKKETLSEVSIWLGSCFGGCDTLDMKDVDLLIQWGHNRWKLIS